MAVQVATLDILTERAHFDPEVARAMGDAIDMELKTSRETLATQQDISDLKQATKQDIGALKREINELRHDVKQEINEFRHDVKHDIKDLKLSLSQEYAKGKDEITRWMLAITLTMISFIFGLAYYVMQHVH